MAAPTAAPSRQQRRKAETSGRILDAAERLFLAAGYEATGVGRLAEEADVSLGSIYGHFGGKEGVYAALIDRALELDLRYCDEGWATGDEAIGRLAGLSDGYLRFAREHPGHFRVFRFPPPDAPVGGPVAGATGRVSERVRSEIDRMAGALEEAIAAGVVRPVDPKRAAIFLWAAWDGLIAAHLLPANVGITEEEFEGMLELGREVMTLGLLAGHGEPR